ncbi:MAG: cell division protein SepF, partial [Firmicutes bacterium]|nr:cell division protein SepF [Bacillota bacterium]
MEKVLNFLGFVAEAAELAEEDLPEEVAVPAPTRRNRPRVVSLQGAQRQFKVVVFEPKTFEEVQAIVDQLKNHRPVIVNLEESDRALARRIVYFMSGATYA